MKTFYYYLTTSVLIIALSKIIYTAFPDIQSFFLEENSLIENVSAFSYFIASLLCFYGFIKRINKILCGVFCVFSGLAFLEEISFGKVIKHYPSPRVMGKTIDSVHDFLDVLVVSWNEHKIVVILVSLTIITLLIISIFALLRNKTLIMSLFANINYKSFISILALVVLLIISSQIIDIELLNKEKSMMPFYEELFEMIAGIGLVFISWLLVGNGIKKQSL